MARLRIWICVLAGLCIAPLIGCGGPEITIKHILPRAVDMPPNITTIGSGVFSVEGANIEGLGKFAGDSLTEHLARAPLNFNKNPGNEALSPDDIMNIMGKIYIEQNDDRGIRHIRRWDSRINDTELLEVDSLVRKVSVAMEFVMIPEGKDKPWATVEVRESYNSNEDPATRGELGLDRNDNPKKIPANAEIVRELVKHCIEAYCYMLYPVDITRKISLRPTLASDANQAGKAARSGDYHKAVQLLTKARQRNINDVNVLFNLAVVTEANGQLEEAILHYQEIQKLTNNQDEQANQAIKQLQQIQERLSIQ